MLRDHAHQPEHLVRVCCIATHQHVDSVTRAAPTASIIQPAPFRRLLLARQRHLLARFVYAALYSSIRVCLAGEVGLGGLLELELDVGLDLGMLSAMTAGGGFSTSVIAQAFTILLGTSK